MDLCHWLQPQHTAGLAPHCLDGAGLRTYCKWSMEIVVGKQNYCQSPFQTFWGAWQLFCEHLTVSHTPAHCNSHHGATTLHNAIIIGRVLLSLYNIHLCVWGLGARLAYWFFDLLQSWLQHWVFPSRPQKFIPSEPKSDLSMLTCMSSHPSSIWETCVHMTAWHWLLVALVKPPRSVEVLYVSDVWVNSQYSLDMSLMFSKVHVGCSLNMHC